MSENKKSLPAPKKAAELLDMYFLDIRCNLLEAAATLDRIERADGGADALADPRTAKLLAALDILKGSGADRAEKFLDLFSE
ncbi:MAG: hypothetical protein JXR97_01075 [Planctomycetes bacterium]|nr:hypothetical protein [Planctomycetota bacterium]